MTARLRRSIMFKRPIVLLGVALVTLIVFAGAFAPWLAQHDPAAFAVRDRLQAPSERYLLGTDHLGRDVFSRIVHGARISLLASFLVVLLSMAIGIVLGLAAGYSSALDQVVMRFVDALLAFPPILLAIALMAALGPSLANIVVALGIVYGPRMARLVRGSVLQIKELEYVHAAGALGASTVRILGLHVLPNSMSPLIVQGTFTFAHAVLAEASLTFLGAGLPPDFASWGIMLSEARPHMERAPWTAVPPGVAIAVFVLGLNLIGDGLRDFLDPRLKNL
ncbi:MAG: ABC transporter permease [Trueperaceae bacterium]|nr:ABC transporter permease [Trueperaceae bacterium]